MKPFNWSEFPNISHRGLPDSYEFDFVPAAPKRFTFADTSKQLRGQELLEELRL
jgi:hypothetical protein